MLTRQLLILLGKIVKRPILRHIAAFEEATKHPCEVQEALRQRIIRYHADTDFGRDHHFAQIHSVEDFRKNLALANYDYFEPYIARVRRGETRALLADERVLMFALTSGTTAARKYIPVTAQYLADYRRGWNIWGLRAYRDHMNVRLRPILQMSSDHEEFRTEAGIPCGSVTGLTAQMQKRIVRWVYCVPPCAARIKNTQAKYYTVLRLSMPKRVGMLIAANPSTVINLAKTGDKEKERLIRDIHDGTLNADIAVPDDVRQTLRRAISRRDPARARELETIANQTGTLYPKDYWSKNCILGNWTGGSVGAYLRHFPRYYGETPVRDVGLIASEGRFTIPIADATPSGVLDITSHYFEFIPEDEIDSPQPTVLAAHELREGGKYYVQLTTAFGLYRYDMHDVVRVTGFYNGTPMLEFLSKGSHFANLTGEKLSEYHVTGAMERTLKELNLTLTAYSVAPCWDDEQPYYGLFVERGDFANVDQARRFGELLDRRLADANIEYEGKRESQRLGPLRVEFLPDGAWAEWDRERLLRNGGNAEQYKHPCLIPDPSFRDSLKQKWARTECPAQVECTL